MNNKKLDQSLDTIMTDRKANSNRRRSARAANKKNKAAPVGGVHKPTKPAKQGKPAALPNKSNKPVEGKVMISGLVSLQTLSRSNQIANMFTA
jgi:sRNA-binding protein